MSRRVISALKLDFLTARTALYLGFIFIVAGFGVGIMTKQPMIGMVIIMVFSVFLAGTVFSSHERSHSERLYGVLPLKKSEMIIGRYLFATILGLVGIVFAGVIGYVDAHISSTTMNYTEFWAVLGLAYTYFCLAVAISYVVYFKIGFSKAYIFTMIPMVLVYVGALYLIRRTNMLKDVDSLLKDFANLEVLLFVFGLLLGWILLVISAIVANKVYARKEL